MTEKQQVMVVDDDPAMWDVPLAHALQQGQLSREVEELESERKLIFEMLELTRGSRKTTAEILGISERALLYKMEQHGLER